MFVGRESELRTIATLLASARVGDSHVLVLTGEPGIGKSALLTEAEALAEGMTVLRARGLESEQVVPFGGLLHAVRPLLGLLDQIPAPQSRALSSALLLDVSGGTEPSRFAVGAATLSLLARAAEERPVAVMVDDAHWLDQPSVEALLFAARRLAADAVAVLVAVRAGHPGARAWESLPGTSIGGLEPAAAAALVRAVAGPVGDERMARLQRVTAGNPLALLELRNRVDELALLPEGMALPVSEQLSRAFTDQVDRLSPAARTVLLVAAADSASAAAVSAAASRLGITTRLNEAEDAGLVRVHADRVEFRHPLVRSAVYGAADAAERRAVHRALAAVVPREETDRLAWHLARGAVAPDEDTAMVLDVVARDAAARGAYGLAALAHERAAELGDSPGSAVQRLTAAGEAAWLAGQSSRAVDLLDRALDADPESPQRSHVLEVRGAIQTRCGSLPDAICTYLEGACVGPVDADRSIRLWADAVHAAFYLLAPDSALLAARNIEEELPAARDPRTRALGTVAFGMAQVLFGSAEAGLARLRTAVPELVFNGDDVGVDEFRLPLLVQGALWLRDSGPRRVGLNEAIDRLRERAALGSLPYLLMHSARDAASSDRWSDAEVAYLESIRLARETSQTTDLAVSLAGLAMLEARQGKAGECRRHASEAETLADRHSIGLAQVWLTFARGDLAAGLEDLSTAVACYGQLQRLLADHFARDPDLSCAPELVEVEVHLGHRAGARAVAEAFARQAAKKGHPWSLARSERALAFCASGATAETHFQSALEWHAQTPDVYERARSELGYGAWLRRERRRTDARPVLAGALETFDGLGAAPWADRAARELAATGMTARRRTAPLDELTPQERQVAQLLAAGRTTREAAAALFLSPKTIEYHLRHVYLKLGISSRAELATRMAEAAR